MIFFTFFRFVFYLQPLSLQKTLVMRGINNTHIYNKGRLNTGLCYFYSDYYISNITLAAIIIMPTTIPQMAT